MGEKIFYINDKEQSEFTAPYVHIYGVRSLEGQLDIAVYSDSSIIELTVNGVAACRQKSDHGAFDFLVSDPKGIAVIRAQSVDSPEVFDEVDVDTLR